jgi:hypothetical protein
VHDAHHVHPYRRLLIVLLPVTLAVMAAVPLLLRGAQAHSAQNVVPSYLPALEPARQRLPSKTGPIEDLKYLDATWVFIGDSIPGTRVDHHRFAELNDYEATAVLLRPGTGPAYWYLAFKNWVVASGVKPRLTFIYFRDYNLTDTMFRLSDQYRWSLDEVARDTEPALNAAVAARVQGSWARARARVVRSYNADRVRDWLEPALRRWPALLVAPAGASASLPDRVNERFHLDKLRPFQAADMEAADRAQADFERMLPSSILPPLVRLAKSSNLQICFVRARRRPNDDGSPPPQPDYLRRYVADLSAWLRSQGMLFIDDTPDDRLTLDLYEDGDHMKREARPFYTDLLNEKVQALLKK